MKITTFITNADGSLVPNNRPQSAMDAYSRMDRAMFEQAHGGAQVIDLAAHRVNSIPDGTILWRTKSGNLMAIAD